MLGSNVCEYIKNEFQIIGGYLNKVPCITGIDKVLFDIKDHNICSTEIKKINPDVVIHCAALADMDFCEINPKIAYEINSEGTENILKSIDKECHFIYISTDNIYNNGFKYNKENATNNITNVYGASKLEGEVYTKKLSNNYTILRTNFFGWDTVDRKKGLFHFVYNNLLVGNSVDLFQDVFFTPISIPYLIKGIKKIVNNNITGIYNIGGRERLSKYRFGISLADAFGLDQQLINPISIDKIGFIAKRPKEMSMNSNKIKKYVEIPNSVLEQLKNMNIL